MEPEEIMSIYFEGCILNKLKMVLKILNHIEVSLQLEEL
jgi:hypothetical protein